MSNISNKHFEAVGSYLRPAELKEARVKFAEGQISATDLRNMVISSMAWRPPRAL